ncbi:MAG: hypothetical protein WCE49_01325 [Terrimicrobiaceae bacterium]
MPGSGYVGIIVLGGTHEEVNSRKALRSRSARGVRIRIAGGEVDEEDRIADPGFSVGSRELSSFSFMDVVRANR